MRILFVGSCGTYGIELLFEGLLKVLGWENVIDFPRFDVARNPSSGPYFGGAYAGLVSDQPEPDRANITRRAREGEFDLMVVSNRSCRQMPSWMFHAIPTAFLDDEHRAEVMYATEIATLPLLVYFKRQAYITTPFIRPLPYGYPEQWATPPSLGRPHQVAGLFTSAMFPRELVVREFAPHFRQVRIIPSERAVSRVQYRQCLAQTRIGLDIRGFGWGTMRRLESIASGCVLLAEPLPISEPHPFIHGEDCWTFTDTEDAIAFAKGLGEDRYMEMATRSYEKFLKHHTTKARAEQFLNDVEEALNRR